MVKILPSQCDGFIARPDPAIKAVLVYGPDTGLVSERVRALANSVVPGLDDPFRVARLSGAEIRADPARLGDEAAALSMTGGRRVVLVRIDAPAVDDISKPMGAYLDDPPGDSLGDPLGDSLVIVEAGDLSPRAPLRKLFESAKAGAAVPCYVDDARSLGKLIDATMAPAGVTLTRDARGYLLANLGGDRSATRRELEKLVLYAGQGNSVSLAETVALIGDSAALSLEEIAFAAAGGNAPEVERKLARALAEGTTPIAVLRAQARHLMRLQLALQSRAEGKTAEQAMKALRPPVFFAFADPFERQMGVWSREACGHALIWLTEAELACKSTGMPGDSICSRTLMRIAQTAR